MEKRKPLGKRIRFEVFKRDSFTCQYCGKSAPEVVLHIDHISPVAGGGTNDIMNLVTSCQDCNLGKGAKELSDKSIIEKQKQQLDELNEKRLQLEMLIEWREGLNCLIDIQVDKLESIIYDGSYSFSEHGRNSISKLLKRYGFNELCDAAETSRQNYAKYDKDGKMTSDSADKVFNYTSRIAATEKKCKENPALKDLYYIRGIVRNRMTYCNDGECLKLIKEAYEDGFSIETIKEIAISARNWTQWRRGMMEILGYEG